MCKILESTVEFKGILGKRNEKRKNNNNNGNVVKGQQHHFCFCG